MIILYDTYNNNIEKDKKKKEYYEEHVFTKEEQEKTLSIRNKIIDFVKTVRNTNNLKDFNTYIEKNICFFEGVGYISSINSDKNITDIYYYGKTEEEAFIKAIMNYENAYNIDYEEKHRKELNEDYNNRFFDSPIYEGDYHGPFFFAELCLRDFRKYYKDNIPKDIINYYESYIQMIIKEKLTYDYKTNSLTKEERTPRKRRVAQYKRHHNKY